MAEVKKRIYRLFKVAKELNVASSTLVEHLKEKGHDVDNSPNTKLPSELYDILLKKFASDKVVKERAEQLIEKQKESRGPKEDGLEEKAKEETISAADLRETFQPRRKRRRSPDTSTVDTPKAMPTPSAPTAKEPTTPPVEETKVPEESTPAIKVVGKIDLDKIDPKKAKTTKSSKTAEPPVEEPKAIEEIPPQEEALPAPVEEKTDTAAEEIPAVVNEEPAPPPAEVEEVASPPIVEEGEEIEGEDGEIIRAGDNAPRLSGLKVMGKIDLPTPGGKRKRPRKGNKDKENEGGAKTPANASADAKSQTPAKGQEAAKAGGEETDDKKRRKRRRKRKRKGEGEGGNNQQSRSNNNNRSEVRKKKEKPTKQEVDQSIKRTLSRMGQGSSRRRQQLRRAKRDEVAARREQELQEMEAQSKVLEVTEFITANEFANMISVPVNEIITKSFMLGMMISINQRLDAELLTIIGEEYGYEVKLIDVTESEFEIIEEADDPADLEPRSPIITVMGHVDHGKTTLLDNLRKANVAAGEAGGITQHIGAYEVKLGSGERVTFLDTPGHEAFTAMRARGAKATDVVIIVVAADDAVMPQTKEAINHAEAAEVPIIFAINKIDKNGADPERIKGQLAELNYLVEDWGGKVQSQEISALKGTNVQELLEKVILEAELLELKANPDRTASGTVIESRVDKGRGSVATMLVQNGTLRVGDEMVAGVHYGKVRALINQNGKRIDEAGPSTPVQVLGLGGQPTAGDSFYIFEEDGKAKQISQKRQELYREQQLRNTNRITLEEIGRRRALGNFEELNVLIKGDVDGSVEALSGSLLKLSTDEVQVNILTKGVGAITEGDVLLASASDAVIIAFNVRPNSQARKLAEKEAIDIRTYSVIYDAIDDVRDALEGLLSPELKEEINGTAEVREVFKVSRVGTVAGSMVTSGKVYRNDPVRVIRDGVVIYDSILASLKRFKDDAKEVAAGYECGIMVDSYNDVKVGDVIESYKVNEVRRKLKRN
ncbi:MAG: translation initiation factor IF-2 [Bacteroidota bacterium]